MEEERSQDLPVYLCRTRVTCCLQAANCLVAVGYGSRRYRHYGICSEGDKRDRKHGMAKPCGSSEASSEDSASADHVEPGVEYLLVLVGFHRT